MDFFQIKERVGKNKVIEVYPDFKVTRSKDLMVRARSFYAIWDEERGLWSTDEFDVQRLVDKELMDYRNKLVEKSEDTVKVKLMGEWGTKAWQDFRNYIAHLSDNAHQLDESLTFVNTEVKKKDYISRRLPYSLEEGSTEAFDEIIETLYDPEERAKLQWAIGAIVSGDAKIIQKFIVLYGEGGTGKSTMLNIIQKLFVGYYTAFEAKALTSSNNNFSTEVFRNNPLVAVQHDGDLSRIEDNTKLNSIVAHEEMTMNEKYKPSYTARANCFLFVASNKPVRITDAKSGIIRRLIDVKPSGKRISTNKYFSLMGRIDFELGAIAYKCLKIYEKMGKNYYSNYKPIGMMMETDTFFNFVEDNFFLFLEQGGVSLSQAYSMYKEYCEETLIEYKLARHKFREELKNYFESFSEITRINGKQVRSYYSGIIKSKFISEGKEEIKEVSGWLSLDKDTSIFDEIAKNYPAQYANEKGTPYKKWANNKDKLSDINTNKLHYVRVPQNHIVIDFDIRGENGAKSSEENIKEANKFPPTYAEYSKSQAGVHLHYIYDGDVSKLSNLYSTGIEVKVFNGEASLRRKLSKCNNIGISTISSGLPIREEKMINLDVVKSEKGLRDLIERNLRKEIHPNTKPSVDFIYKILEDAYNSGMIYDLSDMRMKVLNFALKSSNQADYCFSLVGKMHFRSEEPSQDKAEYDTEELTFFDVEVFPNLFWISWKYGGEGKSIVHMINPDPQEVEELLNMKLVGFNCRRYDNHILYARYIGYSIEELYTLSKRIINQEGHGGLFGEAYAISFADVYDFSTLKQSLKKFEIELGIPHKELSYSFDEPLSKEYWEKVGEYCANDVLATETVFNARKEDFIARQILAELSGLTINDTTQMHVARIILGKDSNPQNKFIYTDLSKEFPGYRFENGKSFYREEEVGEGGYVHAEPGYYENVALLDVASMHPTTIERLNLFGPYTKKYVELKEARLAIKHKDFDLAKTYFNGALAKYLSSKEGSEALAYALKIAINIVYGLTSARFDSKFKDKRNIDNIVAKRGALFMIDLKYAVQEQNFQVIHIKTDSIKIPNATPEIIEFVIAFGKEYGYNFEHEKTYSKMCLVNDAVYIAKNEKDDLWDAVGAQFQHPYIYKTFTEDQITISDLFETKTVTTALYLDMNEDLPEEEHNYIFIGKAGSFCPIKPGCGGGLLMRKQGEKYYAATGSKGFRWLESEQVKALGKEEDIDLNYFRKLLDDAIDTISKYVDFNKFRL
jgi:hypothetical protein